MRSFAHSSNLIVKALLLTIGILASMNSFVGRRGGFMWIRPCQAWTTTTSITARKSTTVSRLPQQQQRQQQQQRHLPMTFSSSPHQRSTTRLMMSTVTPKKSLIASPLVSSIDDDNNNNNDQTSSDQKMINLHTIPQLELEAILKSWGQPKYRAQQIWNWVRVQGVSNIDEMLNIPKKLKTLLKTHATIGSLELDCELISKDGTIKRAYRLADGQLIESVLMPYEDGRYTACISSQAGCAQGCVFCATGQMGFSRQLTADEIFEQVARFASELAAEEKEKAKESKEDGVKNHGRSTRLSNIVFMGMGEPLANYRNVKAAVQRIHDELGVGHRKITISTVGIVPNIAKLAADLPQVRLAVSLHCANDEERTALLPANQRYGGLDELMQALKDYIQITGKRITLEWALIEGENDTPETAHQLGKLVKKWLRRDMVHVNVIPLNPTGGYGGSPSGRKRVNAFCHILEDSYKVTCTPRVRRGIDINAGCGQLKAEVEKRQRQEEAATVAVTMAPTKIELPTETTPPVKIQVTPVVDDDVDDDDFDPTSEVIVVDERLDDHSGKVPSMGISMEDDEDWEDYEYETTDERTEASRLLSLVKDTTITPHNAMVDRDINAAESQER